MYDELKDEWVEKSIQLLVDRLENYMYMGSTQTVIEEMNLVDFINEIRDWLREVIEDA